MAERYIKAFVSYSSKDEKIVSAVISGLDQMGIYAFFAPVDLRPGMDIVDWINVNIDSSLNSGRIRHHARS